MIGAESAVRVAFWRSESHKSVGMGRSGRIREQWLLGAVLLALGASLFLPSWAVAETTRIELGRDLLVPDDLLLRGLRSEARVTFTRPAHWRVQPASNLHVLFSFSEEFLPQRSSLTIRVGDQVKTVPLRPSADGLHEVVVPINPKSLEPYNTLIFEVVHDSIACDGPFAAGMWTKILRTSYFEFVHENDPVVADMAVFPYPYFDSLGYPPTELGIVLPRSPSSATLTALGKVLARLSSETKGRPFDVELYDELPNRPGRNVIVVGTPSENPAVAALAARAGAPSGAGGLLTSTTFPEDPTFAALGVTGDTPQDVLLAADALGSPELLTTFFGPAVRVTSVPPREPAPAREWQDFVPSEEPSFELRALGFADESVRGSQIWAIGAEMFTLPDVRVVDRGAKLDVHYAYSEGVLPRMSTLEIRLNGVTLHSVRLEDAAGSPSEHLEVSFPGGLVRPINRFEFDFHLFPLEFPLCDWSNADNLSGTIFADTLVTLPREHALRAPDLWTFANWGFPFTIRPDLSETAFVLFDPENADAISMMLETVLFLSTRMDHAGSLLEVYYASEVPDDVLASKHLVFVSPSGAGGIAEQLAAHALSLTEANRARLSVADRVRLDGVLDGSGAVIEEIISPWASDRVALVVRESRTGLRGASLAHLRSPDVLQALQGNIAVVSGPNHVRTARIGAVRTLEGRGFFDGLRGLLSRSLLIPLLLLLVGAALVYWTYQRIRPKPMRELLD